VGSAVARAGAGDIGEILRDLSEISRASVGDPRKPAMRVGRPHRARRVRPAEATARLRRTADLREGGDKPTSALTPRASQSRMKKEEFTAAA
jgi:hypothetical protein